MAKGDKIPVAMGKDIESVRKVVNGIRRKLTALSGYVSDYVRSRTCRIRNYTTTGFRIYCNRCDAKRYISVSLNPTSVKKYCVYALGGKNFTHTSLYSASVTDAELKGVWIDGKKYDDFAALSDATPAFNNIMWLHTVALDGYTINVCTRFSADGLQITESIPEALAVDNPLVKSCVDAVYSLAEGEKFKLFTPSSTNNEYMIEKVEDLGQTVVKTFYFI